MSDRVSVIRRLGRIPGPEVLAAVQALYHDEQMAVAATLALSAADLAYGPDDRQTLDLYGTGGGTSRPILLWVHGGGFVRGEKRSPHHPYNAHVGRWAARCGMVGAVMNYRLAPDHRWPSGGEDVAAAVDWLAAHGAEHGGDPGRIVLMGTSAGATHVATALVLRPDLPVRASVLLSGLYGHAPIETRDEVYLGPAAAFAARGSLAPVVDASVPLMLACAEFDPPRFQADTLGLANALLARQGALPALHVAAGHNHFSIACHLGTRDTRLADAIRDFLQQHLEDTQP